MKFWLDTEFNEYRGALISMALACEDGSEWYEVLPCANPGPWVAQHVMPIINKAPLVDAIDLAHSLFLYLKRFDSVHIIVDWPEDISFFCNALIIGPGQRVDTPKLTFEIDRNLPDTSEISAIPHNALEDAKALRKSVMAGTPQP